MWTAQDPDFENRVRRSFELQRVMATLGARLLLVNPGEVTIELPFRADLTQQHGFLHAGIVTTVLDSACGYAAFSLMPAEAEVLAVEFKTNFLSPALGQLFVATGRVLKPGKTLTICQGEVRNEADKLIACMQSTMIAR